MNEFAERWTRGVETRGIRLKDAVCLLGPNHVQALQLRFPTSYIRHLLSLDQASALCFQLHGDTALFPLVRSEGFFRPPAVFNIDGYSVPLNDVALLVAERSNANQEPAVFPVSPPQTHFVF